MNQNLSNPLGQIFLGKPFHWLLFVRLVAIALGVGIWKLHVTSFNIFITVVVVATLDVLITLLVTSAPGERVTREEIHDDDAAGDLGAGGAD